MGVTSAVIAGMKIEMVDELHVKDDILGMSERISSKQSGSNDMMIVAGMAC